MQAYVLLGRLKQLCDTYLCQPNRLPIDSNTQLLASVLKDQELSFGTWFSQFVGHDITTSLLCELCVIHSFSVLCVSKT